MPYFSIETNQAMDDAARQKLMKKTSQFVAELTGKPEQYVMIAVEPGTAMTFGGGKGPTAFVRLKSIGLPTDRCAELSEKICDFIEEELGVPGERTFIDFNALDPNLFGWNGKTF